MKQLVLFSVCIACIVVNPGSAQVDRIIAVPNDRDKEERNLAFPEQALGRWAAIDSGQLEARITKMPAARLVPLIGRAAEARDEYHRARGRWLEANRRASLTALEVLERLAADGSALGAVKVHLERQREELDAAELRVMEALSSAAGALETGPLEARLEQIREMRLRVSRQSAILRKIATAEADVRSGAAELESEARRTAQLWQAQVSLNDEEARLWRRYYGELESTVKKLDRGATEGGLP